MKTKNNNLKEDKKVQLQQNGEIQKPSQSNMTKNKNQNRINGREYIIGGIIVLFSILYLQFQYFESPSSNAYSNIKQSTNNQSKPVVKPNTINKIEDEEVEQLSCTEIFRIKRNIDNKKLMHAVEQDLLRQKQIEQEKINNLKKQVERQHTLGTYSKLEIKNRFRKGEKEENYEFVSDTYDMFDELFFENAEEDSENKNNDDYSKTKQKINTTTPELKQNVGDQNQLKIKKIKQQKNNDIPNIERISSRDLTQLECFLEFYDENEQDLTFEVIKLCEFIEYEFTLLKFENKSSLYDLMINYFNLIQHIQKQKIPWNKQNYKQEETTSKIFYLAKVILNDLFLARKSNPELFIYSDPEIEELLDLYNAIPIKETIKNLVEVWENNWVEMGLRYPNHIAITKQQDRKAAFDKVINQQNMTNASSSRIKQQANLINQQKKERGSINQTKAQDNQTNSNIMKDQEIQKEDSKNLDFDEWNELLKEENSQSDLEFENLFNNHKKHSFVSLDDKEPSFKDLGSEELDEIISLESQIKELWHSREWKKNYKGLQYNDFLLATRKQYKK